ncbi:MAG: HAMP domain-containing histidine kinase, partial [Desulfobulbaceae bacterium]|nr:HAMP domain-containing histidine kinase [Desulfobulbaceae bacterium]
PLNGIMGFTSLLLGDNNLADKQRQMVNMVRNSSELMLEIVNDILVLSRLESGNNDTDAAPIPLAPVINLATASLQQSAFKKGVLLKMVNNCTCEAIIDGNRHSLLRIINNLLSNAIKFTQADGTVTVSLGMEEDHMLHLRVTDTGIGIPKELLPRLFEKFTKASRPGTNGEPGTGLGLAITKRLVEQQGGTIEVSSSEGIGSCFCLAFPISSMSR